ncbi:MAG: hypothetical protein DWQ05_05990 [Calditrichaeota bacterium]|nr:MAG: hypothetical protein DWQ05_05990 [Calditrichota bacterium]
MRKQIHILLSLLFFPILLFAGTEFKAGAALRVVTPDPLLPISGGVGIPQPATMKKGDLFVRALVLDYGRTPVAFVSIDNLGWPAVLGDRVRKQVKGIAPENILIGATHTHSAPDAYGFADADGNTGADLKYIDFCVRKMAEAIQEAFDKRQPAGLKIAMGEAKGKIAFNYYAAELYDPRCGVIQAVAKDGKNIATLVNYAIHPEVLGNDRGILSPDLCGPLYERIEKRGGGLAIFMNSAIGGMVTADVRDGKGGQNNTWEECIRIGELLADEALRIVAPAKFLENPAIHCTNRIVKFPLDSPLLRAVLQQAVLDYPIGSDGMVSTRINLLNVGPAQILTIPGEALPNIGYFLKRKMKTDYPFLFGLTNDAFGYILTPEDFDSFKRYDYISRTSLGEMTGEIFVEQALQMIAENPAAK